MYLSLLPLNRAEVAYGKVGLCGELGYGNEKVVVQGVKWPYAISAHGPSRVVFELDREMGRRGEEISRRDAETRRRGDGGFEQRATRNEHQGNGGRIFESQVALNGTCPHGASRADFRVIGDGVELAAVYGVTSHETPVLIRADITDVYRLELVVDTISWNLCHSVWLDARVGEEERETGRRSMADCLWRTRIWLPEVEGGTREISREIMALPHLTSPTSGEEHVGLSLGASFELQAPPHLTSPARGEESMRASPERRTPNTEHRICIAERRTPNTEHRICIASVVSPGFTGQLDAMLTSLKRFGRCEHAMVVVFAVDADEECRRVIAKHNAVTVECSSSGPLNCAVKSLLYSTARVIEADIYLCMDADILVTGDLNPLFRSMELLDDDAILATPDPFLMGFARTLEECMCRFYGGTKKDMKMLLGSAVAHRIRRCPLIVNDGVFVARRPAMVALDTFIRSLAPRAANWIDSGRHIVARNQFFFNLALAHLDCGVALSDLYNMMPAVMEVEIVGTGEISRRDAKAQRKGTETGSGTGSGTGHTSNPRVFNNGREVRIVHFAGRGREEYERFKKGILNVSG